jgi:hypothetical protein
MNQELPNPARKALARQRGGEDHPSPDALTAFVERTLPRDERDLVTSHLALCADCREVVFLASSAAEDAVIDEEELVAAAAAREMVPTPVYGNALQQPVASAGSPRRRWGLGMGWAAAAVVGLAVFGVVIWQRVSSRDLAHLAVSSVASSAQTRNLTQPAASPMSSTLETSGKTTQAESAIAITPRAAVAGAPARKATKEHPSAPRMAAASADESAQTAGSVVGGAKVAAAGPGTNAALVGNQADTLSQLRPSEALAKPALPMRLANAARGQWRISADGRLEHRVAANDWTGVLSDQATTFRVVTVVGNDVWAGGSGGALFHSSDAGQHWSQVPLVTSSGAETGNIVSIQFSDPQQGTVITGSGSRWSTSDGGVTWASR